MKSYSIWAILLLGLVILLLDILTFYWLGEITKVFFLDSTNMAINIAFWLFTVGLLLAIFILRIRLDNIAPERRHSLVSSLYGLTISSFIPKLIFSIVIMILYFSNSIFSEKESVIIVPLIGLVSGFLPFFVILYAIFRSLYRFKIHHVTVNTPGLPDYFKGLRIVQISDIHVGSFNYRHHIFDRAVKLINDLNPDLVFFTGDLVNNYAWELRGWNPSFSNLKANIGKYSVLGNHDYGDYGTWESEEAKEENFDAIKSFHTNVNFALLLNESKRIHRKDQYIEIVGVENWGKPPFKQYGDLKKALVDTEQDSFKILLSHDPSHWNAEVLGATNIALTLSGHTHGMQAGVQFKNKAWSPIKYKYKHWMGLYENVGQYLYVNRGLGWIGFPGRFGMRPEITCITLEN